MSPTSYRAAPPRDAVAFARHLCEKSFLAKRPLPVNEKIIFRQIFSQASGSLPERGHPPGSGRARAQEQAVAAFLDLQSGSRQRSRAAAVR